MFKTTPHFWYGTATPYAMVMRALLIPLSFVWRAGAYLRYVIAKPEQADLPVICVGNISVGGTGKTPITAYLCQLLRAQGMTPYILTRGYGGGEKGPIFADPALHSAADIGDEALMLSSYEKVCVSADRILGARFISAKSDADIIIMDDGMQNPWLKKDLVIGVFDGAVGVGNGLVFPAGPLRQSLAQGLPMIDIVVINGTDETNLKTKLKDQFDCLSVKLVPDPVVAKTLKRKKLIGFAGIGRPARFFDSLRGSGGDVIRTRSFADHHPYSALDLTQLYEEAWQTGAHLVTTQKDWVRLPANWREEVTALGVSACFSKTHEKRLLGKIFAAIEQAQGRQ